MQRYRHHGASNGAAPPPVEEIHAEGAGPETGGCNQEEVHQTEEPDLQNREGRAASVEPRNGRRSEGGAAGAEGGPRFSTLTWLLVLGLLGVWSSAAVLYFHVVDYDSVLARAQQFRMNFSEVLQGKLAAYDTDGDGDFDADDAKVLLGLTKDGGGGGGADNGESLEEVLNILAEEGSDWIYGFFTFLYDVVSPPAEPGEAEEGEGEEEGDGGGDVEVKGVVLDLQDQ